MTEEESVHKRVPGIASENQEVSSSQYSLISSDGTVHMLNINQQIEISKFIGCNHEPIGVYED